MEQKIDNKKKIMKIVVWVVVILALLGSMHILVNYFDLFEFVRKLHGGQLELRGRVAPTRQENLYQVDSLVGRIRPIK